MRWAAFAQAAPEIAGLIQERFEGKGLVLIGTLRRDGSPRISPVEPYFVHGHVLLGMMSSRKALDLLRDARCVVHNAVSDPNGSEGECKLRGRGLPVQDPELWADYRKAYARRWQEDAPETFPAQLFDLDIESATFIAWDTVQGNMVVKRWTSERGFAETRRKYP